MNMSIPFDLNIKNYNLKELEELFELSANNYDNNLIEQKENYLRNNIINSEIDLDLKNKTILFINEVKNILINNLYQFPNQNSNQIFPLGFNTSFERAPELFIVNHP